MADAGGEATSLLPASQLRAKHSKLSKRAALLLRHECDKLGAMLVKRAMRSRRTHDGPLDSAAVWDALLDEPSLRWLVKRLLELEQESGARPGAPTSLPRPPGNADPSSSWLPPLVWADWNAYRASSKGWTKRAAQLSLRTLVQLHAEGNNPKAVIEQSIERGWTGLFPVKGERAKTVDSLMAGAV